MVDVLGDNARKGHDSDFFKRNEGRNNFAIKSLENK